MFSVQNIPIQSLDATLLPRKNIHVDIARIDLTHPQISGNKWFKLKYNLEEAKKQGKKTLLSFGGAYSNHILALASAGKSYHFNTIAVIRGEEHLPLNKTLAYVKRAGTQIVYMDRTSYREKHTTKVINALHEKYGEFYLIPEGGSNVWAVKGCAEILPSITQKYDYVCTACGTGGTLAGLVLGNPNYSKILGFPALKGGDFLKEDILNLLADYEDYFQVIIKNKHFELVTDYHFGGYAKTKPELNQFIEAFNQRFSIQIEFVYTGKMLFGIFDLMQKDFFPENSKILALHTGGLRMS